MTVVFVVLGVGDRKAHKMFNINFVAPTQNTLFGPPENSLCASVPGKERKRGTHINFFGGFWGQKGGPRQTVLGRKKFSLFFLLLYILRDSLNPDKH